MGISGRWERTKDGPVFPLSHSLLGRILSSFERRSSLLFFFLFFRSICGCLLISQSVEVCLRPRGVEGERAACLDTWSVYFDAVVHYLNLAWRWCVGSSGARLSLGPSLRQWLQCFVRRTWKATLVPVGWPTRAALQKSEARPDVRRA